MKQILILSLSLFFLNTTSAQEFKEYVNGLIYSPKAISNLGEIVNSENTAFRACDLDRTFRSKEQGKGYLFTLDSKFNKQLESDLKSGISLDEFLAKYNQTLPSKRLFVKHSYKGYDEAAYIEIQILPGDKSLTVNEENFGDHVYSNWIIKDTGDDIELMYLDGGLNAKEIPYHFARMMQYSECLVDTNYTVISKQASSRSFWDAHEKGLPARKAFFKYIDDSFGEKEPRYKRKDDYEQYYVRLTTYKNELDQFVKDKLSGTTRFNNYLQAAYDEAFAEYVSDDELEAYVASYISKKAALALKRNRRVVGGCSQDLSPRYHAMSIAQLSAETYSWDIFLRAHLDIMNDNFERMSDGSYAYAGRQTYIRELEALNINVPDLILGISYRASNVSENHYYGNVRRLGRAIAESTYLPQFKAEIISALKHDKLDDYNKVILFYLYANLQYNLDNNEGKEFNKTEVEKVMKLLPAYLHALRY